MVETVVGTLESGTVFASPAGVADALVVIQVAQPVLVAVVRTLLGRTVVSRPAFFAFAESFLARSVGTLELAGRERTVVPGATGHTETHPVLTDARVGTVVETGSEGTVHPVEGPVALTGSFETLAMGVAVVDALFGGTVGSGEVRVAVADSPVADAVVGTAVGTGLDGALRPRPPFLAVTGSLDALSLVVAVVRTGRLVTLEADPALLADALVGGEVTDPVAAAESVLLVPGTNLGLAEFSRVTRLALAGTFQSAPAVVVALVLALSELAGFSRPLVADAVAGAVIAEAPRVAVVGAESFVAGYAIPAVVTAVTAVGEQFASIDEPLGTVVLGVPLVAMALSVETDSIAGAAVLA